MKPKHTKFLRFDVASHSYYFEEGDKKIEVPSVTTIIKIIDKSDVLVPWALNCLEAYILASDMSQPDETGLINLTPDGLKLLLSEAKKNYRYVRDDAAALGTAVHDWIECFIKGDALPEITDERAQNCVDKFVNWVKQHSIRFIHSEQRLYSPTYNFCGTEDWVAEMYPCGDTKCCPFTSKYMALGDIKTSKRVYDEMGMQLAAYKFAHEENFDERIDTRLIVRVGKSAEDIEIKYFRKYDEDFNCFLAALTLYQKYKKNKFFKHDHERISRVRR